MSSTNKSANGLQPHQALLASIKARQGDLDDLAEAFTAAEEDGIYRFYHHSFKLFFHLQPLIRDGRALLQEIAGEWAELDTAFESICDRALSHDFDNARTNANWEAEARPILEAFLHCEYFLRQAARFGRELTEAPTTLPSGWAALLCLYGQR